ncbi:MAG: mersacidin/lichenicidin family type 2 lantibiotic [Holophagales bacterium]|nr:mersacidin/lichenicidin family type 2 lantibiotic [Holophagales bacterium]
MDPQKTIRAWRDDDYLTSLSEEEQRSLLPSPAGAVELPDEDVDAIAGGTSVPCGVATVVLDCLDSAFEGSCAMLTVGCCDNQTLGNGTCAWFTLGCCEPTVGSP